MFFFRLAILQKHYFTLKWWRFEMDENVQTKYSRAELYCILYRVTGK